MIYCVLFVQVAVLFILGQKLLKVVIVKCKLKKVSPRKCRPWLGVVGSDEDEDKNSDIKDTMSDVIPASPISLLSKGTKQC